MPFWKWCVAESLLPPKPKISLISVACRKRSKSAPDATLVEEVDHGGRFGGIYDHQLGVFGTRGWRACVFLLGWEHLLYYKRTYVSSWVSRVSVRCQIDFVIHIVTSQNVLMDDNDTFSGVTPGPCMSQVDTDERRQGRVGICWTFLKILGMFVSKMAPHNPQKIGWFPTKIWTS